MSTLLKVVLVEWTEYERGWGQRPDGCSLYLTEQSAKQHIQEEFDSRDSNYVPDEYSQPTDARYAFIQNQDLKDKLKNHDFTNPFWLFNREYNELRKNESIIVSQERVSIKI